MIYTVTLNPSIDRTLTVERFRVGGTFKATRSDCLPAGKGVNVARVVATLGEPVAALGLVGQDDAPAFASVLVEAGIENKLVPTPGTTRVSVTILDPVCHTETHLREQGAQPLGEAVAQVQTALRRTCAGDSVVFAGSLPPGLPVDTYRTLIHLCTGQGARTLLDTNGPPLLSGIEASPTLLKLNLFELWQVDGQHSAITAEQEWKASMSEVLSAVRGVQDRGISMVVVSMGERGAIGLDPDGRAWHAQTRLDRPLVDAVGSGDALAAGCVVVLARGAPFAEALRLGVACGAANTLVAGAGRCRRSDIERLVARATVVELS